MHEITKEDFLSANENLRFLHICFSAPILMPPWYTAFSKMTFFKRKFNLPVARKTLYFSTTITQ